jgi:hypothetical protein
MVTLVSGLRLFPLIVMGKRGVVFEESGGGRPDAVSGDLSNTYDGFNSAFSTIL